MHSGEYDESQDWTDGYIGDGEAGSADPVSLTSRWSDLRPELGTRGAIVVMFMASLLGHLAARYLDVAGLTGFGFATGCAVATGLTRRRDLLIVVTTPPVIFLAAVTSAEVLTAHANHVGWSAAPIAGGVFLTLASTAPWLFCTVLGALVLATIRGLARCIGDLRSELSATFDPPGNAGPGNAGPGNAGPGRR